MKYNKVLVTGGAGFVGSHLVNGLLNLGLEVTVVDNFSVGKIQNLPRNKRLKVVNADLLNYQKVKNEFKNIDVVFHNAANVSVRNSEHAYLKDARTNIDGTLNVLTAVIDNKIKRLIYASSMAVYGEAEYLPIAESHPLNPLSPYGISKLTGESYCLILGKIHGFSAISLRYFNVFGIRQTISPYVGVITIFINSILTGKQPVVYGTGKQVRDFVAVEDVVNANILAMKSQVYIDTFNIGSGKGKSVIEVLGMIYQYFGKHLDFTYKAENRIENLKSIADITKAKKFLGYKPQYRLEDKLAELISWHKSFHKSES